MTGSRRAPDRIAFLTTDFRPSFGGVADHLHRLADSLAADIPVTVLTTVAQTGTPWARAYDVVALPPLPERNLDRRAGDSLAPIRKLHTAAYFLALRRHAADAMARLAPRAGERLALFVGIWDTASHHWCRASRRAGLPYYMIAHGLDMLVPLYGRLPGWRRDDFHNAARVIVNSRATAALASNRFGLTTAPAVVHPSVGPRPAACEVAARAQELRRGLPSATGPVLLSVGRLVARKGFDLVVRSVAALREDLPSMTYLVAGDGPERPRLQALARDLGVEARVRFLGAIDEATKWAAYDVCDAFVMPNRLMEGADFEGFGIVFLEAALSGRPAIGGRNGGGPDAIADEVTGLLVDPEEPGALTGVIHRLMTDAALRLRLGAAGAARVRSSFSASASAHALRSQLGWI